MAAGTQAYIVGQEYDPRKITLEDFISMFEKSISTASEYAD